MLHSPWTQLLLLLFIHLFSLFIHSAIVTLLACLTQNQESFSTTLHRASVIHFYSQWSAFYCKANTPPTACGLAMLADWTLSVLWHKINCLGLISLPLVTIAECQEAFMHRHEIPCQVSLLNCLFLVQIITALLHSSLIHTEVLVLTDTVLCSFGYLFYLYTSWEPLNRNTAVCLFTRM